MSATSVRESRAASRANSIAARKREALKRKAIAQLIRHLPADAPPIQRDIRYWLGCRCDWDALAPWLCPAGCDPERTEFWSWWTGLHYASRDALLRLSAPLAFKHGLGDPPAAWSGMVLHTGNGMGSNGAVAGVVDPEVRAMLRRFGASGGYDDPREWGRRHGRAVTSA
jgi:hypothetical protein